MKKKKNLLTSPMNEYIYYNKGKTMKRKDRKKLGRPVTTGNQGQAISIYVSKETLAMIRKRADDEDKSASAVVSDAIRERED